jgi:hypothetical protein
MIDFFIEISFHLTATRSQEHFNLKMKGRKPHKMNLLREQGRPKAVVGPSYRQPVSAGSECEAPHRAEDVEIGFHARNDADRMAIGCHPFRIIGEVSGNPWPMAGLCSFLAPKPLL